MVSSRCNVGECRSGDGEASDDSECSERDVKGVRADSDASSLPGGVRHVRQNSSKPIKKIYLRLVYLASLVIMEVLMWFDDF